MNERKNLIRPGAVLQTEDPKHSGLNVEEARVHADRLTAEGWVCTVTRSQAPGWCVRASHAPEIPIPIRVTSAAMARGMLARVRASVPPRVGKAQTLILRPYQHVALDQVRAADRELIARCLANAPKYEPGLGSPDFDARDDCVEGKHRWTHADYGTVCARCGGIRRAL